MKLSKRIRKKIGVIWAKIIVVLGAFCLTAWISEMVPDRLSWLQGFVGIAVGIIALILWFAIGVWYEFF